MNPEAPVTRYVGNWAHSKEMHPLARLPLVLCLSILVVNVYEKFAEGAWVTLVVTGAVVAVFVWTRAHYRKVHIPGHEHNEPDRPFQHAERYYFEPSTEGFGVWRAFGGIVGMMICNDRRWPETYRVLGLQGAGGRRGRPARQ